MFSYIEITMICHLMLNFQKNKIITHITRKFPTIPTNPIWQKRIERPMMVCVDAGSIGENKVPFIFLEEFYLRDIQIQI
jgi:hypothetical protein